MSVQAKARKRLAQVLRPVSDSFDPAGYPDLAGRMGSRTIAAVWKLDDRRAPGGHHGFLYPGVDTLRYGHPAANSLSHSTHGRQALLGSNRRPYPDLAAGVTSEIIRGGAEKARKAAWFIAGGHHHPGHEPKYVCRAGLCGPGRILSKAASAPATAWC